MISYFLVASALSADETGLVTRPSTLSTKRRRLNCENLLLRSSAFTSFASIVDVFRFKMVKLIKVLLCID